MTAPLLELRGLTRDHGRRRVLDRVDLTLEAGTIFGLVGESGAGKSTLARLIMGFDRPSAGTVLLDGTDLFALSPRALAARRRDFQMVFQDPVGALDPRQPVGRIVAEPLYLQHPRPGRREQRRLVDAVLTAVGLAPADADRYPHEFSGGQRQRIAIARALITRPRLLVADEAVSALDLSVKAQILNLLLDLRERSGVAVLFITHDLAVVEAIADRLGVLYHGRLVESGPVPALLDQPAHPYSRHLLAAVPVIGCRPSPIPGAPLAGAPVDWAGCAFRSRCPQPLARCSHDAPALVALDGDRRVACHDPLVSAGAAS